MGAPRCPGAPKAPSLLTPAQPAVAALLDAANLQGGPMVPPPVAPVLALPLLASLLAPLPSPALLTPLHPQPPPAPATPATLVIDVRMDLDD